MRNQGWSQNLIQHRRAVHEYFRFPRKPFQREILLNKKDLYMSQSNTFVGNAIINQIETEILLNTKKQMKSNTHTVILINIADWNCSTQKRNTRGSQIYRVSSKTRSTFVFRISRLPLSLEISSWTFLNSPFRVDFKNVLFFII